MKMFFLLLTAVHFAHAKCDGNEKWIPRIKNEPYETMKARHTSKWLEENKVKITDKKTLLEKFSWENSGEIKLPSKSYSYKFSIDQNCDIQVSKLNFLEAEKLTPEDMNHVLLAGGENTVTAGIFNLYYVAKDPNISITQGSSRFCPNFESLKYVEKKLLQLGWKKKQLSLVNIPGAECPNN